ncbi:MAG: hypothetical protein KIB40_22195 [Pantoea sp.]|jgi:hypothetical protein|uniref:hypothetical protein n=1 Tax=Pantoea sp. TaxID=69393 RepID=UPI00258085A9|nr:hypothetical protein [Pantoea sp.]MBS6035813.1 hypothetical protein [Pantoea sp.]MDU5476122.1 hypothetical protein [Pantoea sp.]
MDVTPKSSGRTNVTLSEETTNLLKKATVEATTRAGTPIKQTEIVNYLIKHNVEDAIKGILKQRGLE